MWYLKYKILSCVVFIIRQIPKIFKCSLPNVYKHRAAHIISGCYFSSTLKMFHSTHRNTKPFLLVCTLTSVSYRKHTFNISLLFPATAIVPLCSQNKTFLYSSSHQTSKHEQQVGCPVGLAKITPKIQGEWKCFYTVCAMSYAYGVYTCGATSAAITFLHRDINIERRMI